MCELCRRLLCRGDGVKRQLRLCGLPCGGVSVANGGNFLRTLSLRHILLIFARHELLDLRELCSGYVLRCNIRWDLQLHGVLCGYVPIENRLCELRGLSGRDGSWSVRFAEFGRLRSMQRRNVCRADKLEHLQRLFGRELPVQHGDHSVHRVCDRQILCDLGRSNLRLLRGLRRWPVHVTYEVDELCGVRHR